MEPRAHFVLIGAVTVVIGVAVFLFVLWLGKTSVDREYDYYRVIFEEAVTGLSEGSNVQFNGIQVGEVVGLKLDPDNLERVVARIRVGADTPIRTDTRAQLGFQGLTGLAFIQLTGGSPQAPVLQQTREMDAPVIVAQVSELQKIISRSGDLFANVNDLIVRLGKLLDDDSTEKVTAVIDDIHQVTGELAAQRGAIERIFANAEDASARVDATVRHFEAFGERLQELTAATDGDLGRRAGAAVGEIEAAARELHAFTRRMDGLLARNEDELDRFIGGGLGEFGHTMQELGGLARQLERLARKLEDNPRRLLLADPDTEEFEPQ